jgi:ATP-dependent DNA helicase RecG
MLTQEKRLGYKNKAVLGGLEKLAPNWSTEALQEATTEQERFAIEEVVQDLHRYPEIAEPNRPRFLHQILVKLHKAGQVSSVEESDQEDKLKLDHSARTLDRPNQRQPQHHELESPARPEAANTREPEAKPQSRIPRQTEGAPKRRPTSKHSYPVSSTLASNQSETRQEHDFAGAGLDSPVTKLPGIKEAMAQRLARLNISTIRDFLTLYPRRYDDYRSLKTIDQLKYDEDVTIIGQVWETRKRESRNRQTIVTSILTDGTATIEATWFNQPWLVNMLKPGAQIVLSGRVDQYLGRLTFQSPEWEELDKELIHTGRLVPIYPLTQGITAKWLRNRVKSAVDYWARRLPDYLPEASRQRLDMLALGDAIRQIHFPDSWEMLEAARRRLAFDELLMIQLGVLHRRQLWQSRQGRPVHIPPGTLEDLLKILPFQLTGAQRRTLDDIVKDLQRDTPMSRLVQGDVGSGKTVVALMAMVLTVQDGGQAALLAPTEILAEQHHKGMSQLLTVMGEAIQRKFNIQLLTGSISASERKEILEGLTNGDIDIVVGTHAIIQEDVELRDLRLTVVDEQHRFGVEQRGALRDKGFNPHMLVMTATPIPRTLALTLYGDLDLSLIDELPPGRQPIETRWLTLQERERAYSFIQLQIEKGRQAFIICPLVEESDKTEAKSAIEEHKRLQHDIFPRLRVGLLHGRMKADEKETVMRAFRDQETHILVSTSVVEVGIDVPNATVMLVEGANRFGLAQLHQFRGRVGRGAHKSYCLLLADKLTSEAEDRLKAIEQTKDGFQLAEYDLKMRGPGEFFGTRQSGLPDLKLVQLSDVKLLELARTEAQLIFEQDCNLEQPQHRLLARQVDSFWNGKSDLS